MVKLGRIVFWLVLATLLLAMRDPTEPIHCQLSSGGHCSNGTFVLSSITVTPQQRIAIINNQSYSEQDRIGSMIVEKIGDNNVILVGSHRRLVLSIGHGRPNDIVVIKRHTSS